MVTGSSKHLSKPGFVDYVIWFFLIFLCLTTLYPFLNVLFDSLANMKEIVKQGGMLLFPRSVHLDSYRYVIRFSGLMSAYGITIFIAVAGTLINLVMTSLGAYVLSTRELPGRNLLMTVVLIAMLFNGGLIPNYYLMRSLGLLNTMPALVLPALLTGFNLILMKTFLESMPEELEEAARIAGAGWLRVMLQDGNTGGGKCGESDADVM